MKTVRIRVSSLLRSSRGPDRHGIACRLSRADVERLDDQMRSITFTGGSMSLNSNSTVTSRLVGRSDADSTSRRLPCPGIQAPPHRVFRGLKRAT